MSRNIGEIIIINPNESNKKTPNSQKQRNIGEVIIKSDKENFVREAVKSNVVSPFPSGTLTPSKLNEQASKRINKTLSQEQPRGILVDDEFKKFRYQNLKLDTLGADITKAGDAVKTVYSGWQDKNTLESLKPVIENAYNRLKYLDSYNADYGDGSVDVSEQLNAFKSILDEWDGIAETYSKYDTAQEYDKAIKNYNESIENKNKDLALYDKEIADLENTIKTAGELQAAIPTNPHPNDSEGTKLAQERYNEFVKYMQASGYKSTEEMHEALKKLKLNKNQASRYQALQNLSSVIDKASENYDKNASKYIKKGKETDFRKVGKEYTSDYVNEEGINTGATYHIDNLRAAAIAMAEHNGTSKTETNGDKYGNVKKYRHLKENEFNVFAYYLGKDMETGGNQALEYLEKMEETLQTRMGTETYEKYLKDNSFLEALYAVPVGLNQFANGVSNLFNTEDDYIPVSSTQVAGQLAREDLKDAGFKLPKWLGGASFGQGVYDTLSTTANMTPSILASAVANYVVPGSGAYVGGALMGASAKGNAYQEALNSGMDKSQAQTYSTLVGVSEAALSAILSKALGGKALSGKIEAAINKIDNGFLKFAANYGVAFVSEGAEEGLQEILTPVFENIALGYNKNGFEDIDWGEVAYSALLGGLSGGNFEVIGSVANRVKGVNYVMLTYNTGEKILNLLNLGLSLPEGSNVQKLAQKYDEVSKKKGKISANKVYNLLLATENYVSDTLTQLGETKNVAAVSSAVVKKLSGVELSVSEIELLSKSSYGQEALNTIVPKTETAPSADNVADSMNSQLQSQGNGGIININEQTGVDIDGSSNPELLEGREVSAVGGSRDGLRQQSENSRKISYFVEGISQVKGNGGSTLRAGDSGWLIQQADQEGEVRDRFEKGLRGKISRIAPSGFDTIGRKISSEIKEKFKNTIFKDNNGNLLSLYHWTQATFEAFAKGEFGFHFGTLDAAHDRYTQSLEEDSNTQKGIYKEVYLNIKHPYFMAVDAGAWAAQAVALQLEMDGLITEQQYDRLSITEGFWDNTYNNPAAKAVRDILSDNGYDGIIYKNDSEDAGSYSVIALYPEQILTVAENGVLKENIGVTEADFTESANFMPGNEGSPLTASDNITAESGKYGLTEPTDKEIYRDPTDEENRGKRKNAKQRHILDVAKKLDGGMKVVFVSETAEVLSGQKGVYMRDTNTVYLSESNSAVESYYQIFKHEFIHRLESKGAYQSFKNYLFRNSSTFERYARAQLGKDFKGTREEAFNALAQRYIDTVQKGRFTQEYKKAFGTEDAHREMVADFISEVLFKGNRKNVAQHLAESDLNAVFDIEDTLTEFESLNDTDRNWFQKIIDTIKDFIASLKGVNQNKRLVEDLEYIEKRLGRVLDSKDTKKAASRAARKQFDIVVLENGNTYVKASRKVINGVTLKEQRADITNFFKKLLKNEPSLDIPTIEGDVLTITMKDTADKARDNYKLVSGKPVKMSNEEFAVKLRVEAHIDEIAETALKENKPLTDDEKSHDFAKDGFEYRTAYFEDFDGQYYKIRFSVGHNGTVATVYNIGKIKEDVPSSAKIIAVVGSQALDGSSSNDILLNKEFFVNSNSMQESKDYSKTSPKSKGQFSLVSPMQQMRDNLKRYENGEITREEYLEKTDELWGKANETYGMLPQGENAKAPIATPAAIAEDKPTERFTRTIIEKGALTEEMLQGMEERVLLGGFSYEVISDDKAMDKADSAVKNGTAEDTWENVIHSKKVNKNQIAIGERLLKDAIESGNTKRVLELSAELADIFTRAGQVVQAARLLKKMTGTGRLVSAQRMVKTINRDLQAKHGVDYPPVKISPETAKRLAEAKTKEGIEHAYEEIMYEVAEQVPVTFLDKWNAWRYFAMLCNPKTHIRNLVGNAIFVPATRIRYWMAVAGEQALSPDKRTKSLIIKKEYRDFAKNDAKNFEVVNLLKGNKYNDKSALREKQRIFKNNLLEFLTRFNSSALEAEDMLFKNKHYIHALAGFLQARNVNLENISQDMLDEARIYAVAEAKKATFNDESALANWIQNFGNKNIFTSIVVEGVLPFKRTPINIVKRGVEYSPIGLTKTLTKGLYDVKKGKITLTEFIDGFASGLTGTGIMLVGMFLANLGFVTGGEKDDDESQFEKWLGKQEYAVEILGKSYTVDWAAPANIPFFIGVEIVNTVNEGEEFSFSQVSNAVWNSLEPITNLSMLSGMQGVIESARYAESSQTLAAIAGDAITSYAMQVVPSLSGALARTIDPTQRSWYTDKNDKWLDATAQSVKNNVQSNVPGLSYTQIPKIDIWGREVSRGGVGERIAENFISPGYYSEIEYNETNAELKRIFKKTDIDVFPSLASKSFEIDGKTKHLTAKEYVTYAKNKGAYSFDYLNEFINSAAYKRLTDEERADVIQGLYEYSNAKAKTTVSNYDLMKRYKTVTNWERNGRSAVDYYIYMAIRK